MKTVQTKHLLLVFFIKSILSSAICILSLSALFAYLIYNFDIDTSINNTISIIICCLSAIITSFISARKLKNNGAVMGAVSVAPIIIYSMFTFAFGANNLVLFAIKAVIMLIISAVIGNLTVNKNRKIKV